MIVRQKTRPLTSLRFFAAFYVVVGHTLLPDMAAASPGVVKNFLDLGFISVGFFFTLSGYILSHIYLRPGMLVDRHRFWLSRFARIYPLFFVSLLLDLPHLLTDQLARGTPKVALAKSAVIFAGNACMLQGWLVRLRELNNPSWSLASQTIFYLSFPFLGVMIWKLRARFTIPLAVIFYMAAMLLVWVAARLHIRGDFIAYNPIFHLHEFLIGILLAKWHFARLENPQSEKTLVRHSPWIILAALALFCVAVIEYKKVPFLAMKDGLLTPLSAMMIVGCCSGNKWIASALSVRWLEVLGEASYGMYLLHIPIWHQFQRLQLTRSVPAYLVFIALLTALSIWGFHFFEAPMRRKIVSAGQVVPRETLMTSSVA
jgi:peptidoglycan/LPS O-acetylase OafA/YrhL